MFDFTANIIKQTTCSEIEHKKLDTKHQICKIMINFAT